MLFDTHCHLLHQPLQDNLANVLCESKTAGVDYFLIPGTQPKDWSAIAHIHMTHVYTAFGLHPWFCDQYSYLQIEEQLHDLLQKYPNAIIGEIGLDFLKKTNPATRIKQTELFEAQLSLAQQLQRPVTIHSVRAHHACITSIRRCQFSHGGFVHGFSGSMEEANAWIKYGFKIGVGTLLLNPRAIKIRKIVELCSLDDMVLETDAPYGYCVQGQPNHPKNTRLIAEYIANIKHTNWLEVAQHTSNNAKNILAIT